jgi:hypothetical protein
MIRYMKERAAKEQLENVEPRVVQPDDPGLPNGSVDRILVVDTWHHIAGRAAYRKKLGRTQAGRLRDDLDFTKVRPVNT